MIDKNTLQFKDLPDWVKDKVLSDKAIEANRKIIKEFNLSDEMIDKLFAILRQLILKQIFLENLLPALDFLGWEEEKKKKLAIKIVKLRLLPIKGYLKTDVASYLEDLGEDISKYPELLKTEESINLDQLIEKINKEAGLSFPDEILRKRFEAIIFSYLKDIRDEISLKEILERPRKVGGMELSAEKVEQIIKILEEERPRVKLEIEIEREKPELAEGMKTPEELVAPTSAEIKPQEIVLPPAQEEIKPPVPVELIVPPEEEKEITKFQLGTLAPVLGVALKEEKEEEKINIPLPPSIEEHKIVGEKRGRMEEIKPRMRISGPIEELRFMTLEDWRRFGRPEAAVSKIEEKVNLLAEESLLKKAEAIKAWKQSEINQLYLEIGRESIDGGNASLNLIIEKRKNETRPFLTNEEFNAIAELNQRLRF